MPWPVKSTTNEPRRSIALSDAWWASLNPRLSLLISLGFRCGTPCPPSRYRNKSDVPRAIGFDSEQRNCRMVTSCDISIMERGGVAQLVEQRTHKPRVRGSKPFTATIFPNTKSANHKRWQKPSFLRYPYPATNSSWHCFQKNNSSGRNRNRRNRNGFRAEVHSSGWR